MATDDRVRAPEGEPLSREEHGFAEAWRNAEVALAKLKGVSDAFEEALTSLQRGAEWNAEVSNGWSSCLALLARVFHHENDEVRWVALSLLDERSRKIVHILLSTMEQDTQRQPREHLVNLFKS